MDTGAINGVDERNQTTYYLRSSVIGGAIINELGRDGQNNLVKMEGYVYAGGQRIAKQSGSYEHHNPVTGSWITTAASNRSMARQERDPMGGQIPTITPPSQSSYVSVNAGAPLFIDGGDPFDYSSGRSIDGLPVSDSEFQRRTGNGSVTVQRTDRQGNVYQGNNPLFFGNSVWVDNWTTTYSSANLEFPIDAGTLTVAEGSAPVVNIYGRNLGEFINVGGVLPQNPIRNVDPILNKVRYLGDNVNNPKLKSMLQVRLMQLLSKGCADAFKGAGLATPEEIINKGLTIASSPLLNDSSNNDTLGISESIRQKAAQSSAPAQTIGSQFTTKGPIIFFRVEAFNEEAYLDEAVAHEFIHAAAVGKFPLWGYSLGRGTDLSGYGHYRDIIDNCGYQNVRH